MKKFLPLLTNLQAIGALRAAFAAATPHLEAQSVMPENALGRRPSADIYFVSKNTEDRFLVGVATANNRKAKLGDAVTDGAEAGIMPVMVFHLPDNLDISNAAACQDAVADTLAAAKTASKILRRLAAGEPDGGQDRVCILYAAQDDSGAHSLNLVGPENFDPANFPVGNLPPAYLSTLENL